MMGKGHRDNHEARLKRGPVAFAKKAKRRAEPKKTKCKVCGTAVRPETLIGNVCARCEKLYQDIFH
jgi:hypothetical protein